MLEQNRIERIRQNIRDIEARVRVVATRANEPKGARGDRALAEIERAYNELRAQSEEVLLIAEAERRRYSELFQSCPDPLIITCGNGVVSNVNPAAAALLGSAPLRLVGQSIMNHFDAASRTRCRNAIIAALAGGACRETLKVLSPGREPRPVEVHFRSSPRAAGLTVGVRLTFRPHGSTFDVVQSAPKTRAVVQENTVSLENNVS
jgi:PAS domain S-box-containing protein